MNIIGIHDGHNASVALMQDGKIKYALSEERLSRKKNQGGFPIRAMLRILSEAGLTPKDLDRVAFCGIRAPRPEWVYKELIMKRYLNYCLHRKDVISNVRSKIIKTIPTGIVNGLKNILRPKAISEDAYLNRLREETILKLGIPAEKIIRLEHHQCHAAGAYYGQGPVEEPILCITCDGGGDGICASVNIGNNGKIKRIDTIPVDDSIAKIYGLITYIMGMVPLEHEYKLMGMAPYADMERVESLSRYLEDNLLWKDNPPKWFRKPGIPPTSYWYEIIREGTRFVRFDVVAGGVQSFIERMMLRWIRGWLRETGLRRIALSGGIFMNVKMNKLIMELDQVDAIYVLPSCGDESNPIGACYLSALDTGIKPEQCSSLGPLYLGPSYPDRDIEKELDSIRTNSTIQINKPKIMHEEVARLLADGKIVARYYGREEFGARALGNRSILADPSRLDVIREINQMIKCRDFWMPFSGTMTLEQAKENVINPKNVKAPYMIMTFDSKNNPKDFHAAIHPYDRSIRPQILENNWNPEYHKILTEFQRITGKKGGLLNTSFNLHGYPIVSSPKDALDVFFRSGLKYLAIGKYIVNNV